MSYKKLIICVCRGNILRSVVAEKLILQHMAKQGISDSYQVVSRSIQGTSVDIKPVRYPNLTYYTSIYQRIKPVLNELGVDLTKHVLKPINDCLAAKAACIIAMDKQTKHALEMLFPDQVKKVCLFSDLAGLDEEILDIPSNTNPTYSIREVRKIHKIFEKIKYNFLTLVGI